MRVIWSLLRIAFFVFLPACLAYLGSDHSLLDVLKENKVLGENFNVPLVKQLFQVASVSITNLILISLYEYRNYKLQIIQTKNDSLISDLKTSFLSAMASELGDCHVNTIRFRVWKEDTGPAFRLKKYTSRISNTQVPRRYAIMNIEGLSDIDNTKGLYFEVYPKVQGLVGRCFAEKIIKYEEDISKLYFLYDLTPFQISKTRGTKFSLCFPIFNDRNDIVTMISLESIYKIKIPEELEETIANMITIFAQDLTKYFPKLLE